MPRFESISPPIEAWFVTPGEPPPRPIRVVLLGRELDDADQAKDPNEIRYIVVVTDPEVFAGEVKDPAAEFVGPTSLLASSKDLYGDVRDARKACRPPDDAPSHESTRPESKFTVGAEFWYAPVEVSPDDYPYPPRSVRVVERGVDACILTGSRQSLVAVAPIDDPDEPIRSGVRLGPARAYRAPMETREPHYVTFVAEEQLFATRAEAMTAYRVALFKEFSRVNAMLSTLFSAISVATLPANPEESIQCPDTSDALERPSRRSESTSSPSTPPS